MTHPTTFPARLTQAREARGFGLVELGEKAGLTRGHISRLESRTGAHVASETIRKLADALRVDAAWLAFGVGKGPPVKKTYARRSKYATKPREKQ